MFGLDLPTLINRVIILVIAFTVHEYMHAFVAYKFGDWTAKNAGRLTLNPLGAPGPAWFNHAFVRWFWLGKAGASESLCHSSKTSGRFDAGIAGWTPPE